MVLVLDPSSSRKGDWMQAYTGRKYWPLSPRTDEVCIEDIAHHLSLLCRFNGAVREFYSVAEHCVRCSYVGCPKKSWWQHVLEWIEGPSYRPKEPSAHIQFARLMHDSPEAYVSDVIRPVKRFLTGYSEIEALNARCIESRFGFFSGAFELDAVKFADEKLLATEARDLMGGESAGKWQLHATPLKEKIKPWSSKKAERLFLERFYELYDPKTLGASGDPSLRPCLVA